MDLLGPDGIPNVLSRINLAKMFCDVFLFFFFSFFFVFSFFFFFPFFLFLFVFLCFS